MEHECDGSSFIGNFALIEGQNGMFSSCQTQRLSKLIECTGVWGKRV